MSHGPIQKEQIDQMNNLAHELDDYFNGPIRPKKWGFALLVFPFGEEPNGRMNYISNGKREDMIVALKEFIARNDGTYHEHEVKQ